MVTTIYITRHGYRANWILDKPVPPPLTGIPADPVLAERGLEQAKELGAHIAKAVHPRPQLILVSPYYRCLQTATPTAQALNLPLCVEHGVTAPVKVLKEHFSLVDPNYIPIEPTTFVSETREELHARAARFITGLIARLEAEQPEVDAVLLVTHAATKIALGRALLQEPDREIRTGTCSLDTFVRTSGSDRWVPERIGDTDFLSKGEEMHWGFENAYAPGSTEDIAARKLGSDPDAIPEMITSENSATAATTGDDEDEQVLNPIGFEAKPEPPEPSATGDERVDGTTPAPAADFGTKRKQPLIEKLALITKRRLEEEKAKQAVLAEREANLEEQEEEEEEEEFGGEEEEDENDDDEENDEDGDVVMKDSRPGTTNT